MSRIFKLKPTVKNYLWGGNRLKRDFDKTSPESSIAEAWELSAYPGSESIVLLENKEVPLNQLFKKSPEYFGTKVQNEEFPILLKLIDAALPLSVQVHPDDEYAFKYENQFGKNEFWHILDADKDSYLYYGLNKDLTKEEFKKAVEENKLENYLNKINVSPGQSLYIPAGTIHAIGPGCLILEVQENSNVTYRIYDYDRIDIDGNKRELHLDKALEVSDLSKNESTVSNETAITTDFFRIRYLTLDGTSLKLNLSKESFTYIFIKEGTLTFKTETDELFLNKGDSAFITAGEGSLKVFGDGSFILVDLDI